MIAYAGTARPSSGNHAHWSRFVSQSVRDKAILISLIRMFSPSFFAARKCIVAVLIALSLFMSQPALAGAPLADSSCSGFDPNDPYGLDCKPEVLSSSDPRLIASRIINVSLSLLGILATSIIVFSGYKWMASGGNEEQIKGAQRMIVAAVIGLVIILSSFAISTFVLGKLDQATNLTPNYFN